MTWENDLSTYGVLAAEIAGEATMTIVSGGQASPVLSVFGAVLAEGIPGIMGGLGLGNSGNTSTTPDYTPYFTAIETQLNDVESTLFQGLSNIQQSVNWIMEGVTDIKYEIVNSELEGLLSNYSSGVNTVSSNFQQYANATAALRAGIDISTTTQAMFNLLSNATDVDIAMRDIYDAVYGEGELQGVLDFQVAICQQAVTTWASNPENLALANSGKNDTTFGYQPAHDNSLLITAPFTTVIPAAITTLVAPTFQAILTAMGQGLIFLGAAWQNTINDDLLELHINNLQNVMLAMNEFWTTLTDPNAVNSFAVTLMNSCKVTVGDLGNMTNVGDSVTPALQPFPSDYAWWATPGQPGSGDDWYGIYSGVANIPAVVTELGGPVDAWFLGVGFGEGDQPISGVVCQETSVTVPTPASAIPSAIPAILQTLMNAQGSINPGFFVATAGTVQQLTCSWAGQPPKTVNWSIEPNDGTAGTIAVGAGNDATYTAPETLATPMLATIQAEIDGSILATAWVLLLEQQPTVQVTPQFVGSLAASNQITFATSAQTASFMGALYSPEGAGPLHSDPVYGSITGLVYTAPASVTAPAVVIALFNGSAGSGYALIQLMPTT
jgi:hypothetical protein